MGRKRKISHKSLTTSSNNHHDTESGKIHAITSYEDIAGSEDEFHMNRDKIMLNEVPENKKKESWQKHDENLELSDNEILSYPDDFSDDISEENRTQPMNTTEKLAWESSELEQEILKDIEEDVEGWGASKHDYYNHDHIETEADALEEEAEALRLQKKRLSKMSAADFGLDQDDWLDNKDEKETKNVVTEILKDIEITVDMRPEERLQILKIRYPEFVHLSNELVELYPVLQQLQHQAETEFTSPEPITSSYTILKFRTLSAYIGALGMYFAIFSSPGDNITGIAQALEPGKLREHPIMSTILQCRELWLKIKNHCAPVPESVISADKPTAEDLQKPQQNDIENTAEVIKEPKIPPDESRPIKQTGNIEHELQELTKLIHLPIKKPKKFTPRSSIVHNDSDNSDFGEEDSIDAKSALEKAQRKKSLRFYTSQITQKSNKRSHAGRNAGGDEDIPHRERLRERQARLNAEAEKRAQKFDQNRHSIKSLSENSGSGDDIISEQVREKENEYYDFIARTKRQKKENKNAKKQAEKQATAEGEWSHGIEPEAGEDGKRAIGYVIEKNKGLAPKRKKEVRNPRVKKRKKFEEKKKKLASTRAIYKGGEEKGGYAGEKTGIKTGLVKSIKL